MSRVDLAISFKGKLGFISSLDLGFFFPQMVLSKMAPQPSQRAAETFVKNSPVSPCYIMKVGRFLLCYWQCISQVHVLKKHPHRYFLIFSFSSGRVMFVPSVLVSLVTPGLKSPLPLWCSPQALSPTEALSSLSHL